MSQKRILIVEDEENIRKLYKRVTGMTAQAVRKDEPEIELSCREAQLLLRTIPLGVVIDEDPKISGEQRAAAKHCAVLCDECIKEGFEKILGVVLSCKAALEVWAGINLYKKYHPRPFGTPQTLQEKLALEHIFGRQLEADATALPGLQWWNHNRFGKCEFASCKETNAFVLSCDSTRVGGAVYENYHHFLLELFFGKAWGIGTILDTQAKFFEEEFQRSTAHEEVKASARKTIAVAQAVALWFSEHRGVLSDNFPHREFFVKLIKTTLGDDSSGLVLRASCGNNCSRLERDCGMNCFAISHSFGGLLQFINEHLGLSGSVSGRFDFIFKPKGNSTVI